MKQTAILILGLALLAVAVGAQSSVTVATPAVLQVASVKESGQNQPGALRMQPGGRIVAANIRVMDMVYMAFRASPPFLHDQIFGLPPWASSVRYNIEAKFEGEVTTLPINPDTSGDIVGAYIRSVLDNRFAFKAHVERREFAAFVLSVASTGFKPTTAPLDCTASENRTACAVIDAPGHIAGHHLSFKDFLRYLPEATGRPVIDRTELSGQFDIDMQWNADPLADPSDPRPSIFGAIQQMGLKLESTRDLVDVLVVDHVERPTAN